MTKSEKWAGRKNSIRDLKKVFYGIGSVAAVFAILFGFCLVNPVLAAEIPIIGSIFEKVQVMIGYGDIPEEEIKALSQREEQAALETEAAVILYQAKDQGITFTLTEYYASNQAIFLGVKIESEEEFPNLATLEEGGYQFLQVSTKEDYSFRPQDEVGNRRMVKGYLEDAHTFVGIMRVDYSSIIVDGRKYDEACKEAELNGEEAPVVNSETRELYFSEYMITDEFEMDIQIEGLYFYMLDGRENVKGNWDFEPFIITQSDEQVEIIEIHDVNEAGIGLESVEISPVEISIKTLEPGDGSTCPVVLDNNGKRLAYAGDTMTEFSTSGYDTSTITVYICDHAEYMDQIKGYALSEDPTELQTKLEEKALYKYTVDTGL